MVDRHDVHGQRSKPWRVDEQLVSGRGCRDARARVSSYTGSQTHEGHRLCRSASSGAGHGHHREARAADAVGRREDAADDGRADGDEGAAGSSSELGEGSALGFNPSLDFVADLLDSLLDKIDQFSMVE